MKFFDSLRARTALAGAVGTLLVMTSAVAPAAASPETIHFTITVNNDITYFTVCPPNTPAGTVCGYGTAEPITDATNDAGDAGLSGTNITISFTSTLKLPPISSPLCAVMIPDASNITLKTTRGNITLVTKGAYCASTNTDLEPFVITGGAQEYAGASGYGLITAHATAPQTQTQGFSSDTYVGTLTLAR
jgi:hypothetical protein